MAKIKNDKKVTSKLSLLKLGFGFSDEANDTKDTRLRKTSFNGKAQLKNTTSFDQYIVKLDKF